jgi:hypothetical protein
MEISPKFYRQKALVSDQIAACVMIAPDLLPSREELPREDITDENLKSVLAIATLAKGPDDMARLALGELGARYLCKLFAMLQIRTDAREVAMVWNLDWYVAQMRELVYVERRHAQAMKAVLALSDASEKEIIPKRRQGSGK